MPMMNSTAGATQPRTLKSLLNKWFAAVRNRPLPQPPVYDGPDMILTGLVEHSDAVAPGKCFIARVRTATDGHRYIDKAIENGASLIIGQLAPEELNLSSSRVPYLRVPDTAIAEAWLSAAWFDFPSRWLIMVGVTGTDGKTTTANLIYQVLRSAGLRAGLLSTVKAAIGETEEALALHVTTPEAPIVQGYLRRMVDSGLTHCVLEATSHGLAQHRVDAIDFDMAVITNVTHEHFDYHGDFEGYFYAKARLFQLLSSNLGNSDGRGTLQDQIPKTAILNRDDPSFERLSSIGAERQLNYGLKNAADVTAKGLIYSAEGTQLELRWQPARRTAARQASTVEDSTASNMVTIKTSLVGEFNVYNLLAAATASYGLGVSWLDIRRGIESLEALSGRMEPINLGQDQLVLVDFAHTPNALSKAISAARGMTKGRIITVFGSAGKRDVAKRRLMAEISARDADLTVLTAEDPRTESLDEILEMMAAGCRHQGGIENLTFWRVPDRGRAIHFALSLAGPDDLVLVCGKGHEQSMCFGTTEYPWDDREATRIALEAFIAGRPMPDLGLPTFEPSS